MDGDEVGEGVELGRKGFGRRDEEEGVRQATALRRLAGAARGLDHPGGAGVDPDHQLIGMCCGPTQDESAVAGTDVDGDRGVRRRGMRESADVELGEAPAVHDVHRPMIIDR